MSFLRDLPQQPGICHRDLMIATPGKLFSAPRLDLRAEIRRLPLPHLELSVGHADGSFRKRLAAIAKVNVLIIDDFAIAPMARTRTRRPAGSSR